MVLKRLFSRITFQNFVSCYFLRHKHQLQVFLQKTTIFRKLGSLLNRKADIVRSKSHPLPNHILVQRADNIPQTSDFIFLEKPTYSVRTASLLGFRTPSPFRLVCQFQGNMDHRQPSQQLVKNVIQAMNSMCTFSQGKNGYKLQYCAFCEQIF